MGRIRLPVVAALLLFWGTSGYTEQLPGGGQSAAQTTGALLARARGATGADRIRVRSLTANGTVYSGFNGVTGQPLDRAATVHLKVQCPDYYVRVEEDGRRRRSTGFAQSRPILTIVPLRNETQVGVTPIDDPGAYVNIQRNTIGLFLLGALGDDSCGTLKVRTVTSRDTPPNVGVVRTQSKDEISIDFDPQRDFPLRVRYLDIVSFPKPLSEQDKKQGRLSQSERTSTEITLSFEDRRAVAGIMFPYVFRKVAKGVRLEQISFDEVTINPTLSPDQFGR